MNRSGGSMLNFNLEKKGGNDFNYQIQSGYSPAISTDRFKQNWTIK